MKNSSKKAGGAEIPKRKRSLDLKSLYNPRVPAVGESKKKVPEENDHENSKRKKKRSRKEVSLSCFESDAKKSRKEDSNGVESELGFSQKSSDGSKELSGISLALGENGNAFNFPKRLRGLVGRKKLETSQVSELLGLPKSLCHIKLETVHDPEPLRLTKPVYPKKLESGQVSKPPQVTKSVDHKNLVNDQDSEPAGVAKSVDRKRSKTDQASKPSVLTKSVDRKKLKADQVSKSSGLTKSVDREKLENGQFSKLSGLTKSVDREKLEKAQISKPVGLTKSVDRDKLENGQVSKPMGLTKSGDHNKLGKALVSKPSGFTKSVDNKKLETGKVFKLPGLSKSVGPTKSVNRKRLESGQISKPLALAKSINCKLLQTGQASKPLGLHKSDGKKLKAEQVSKQLEFPKSDERKRLEGDQVSKPTGLPESDCCVGAFNGKAIKHEEEVGPNDHLVRLFSFSAGNDGSSNSKSAGKVDVSNSKTKQKADVKSTGKGNNSNVKLKRKSGADGHMESKDDRLGSIRDEKEDSVAVNNGDTSSTKQSNSREKKDLFVGKGADEASKKKFEPSVSSLVSDSVFVGFDEEDDEENLEQNAARMLSSRFDPSCTGFSSKRISSESQTANGFPFRVSSSRNSLNPQANSSGCVDSASADDKSRVSRSRREDKGKGVSRKHRHFYEICSTDLDPLWFLNRKIKVFWPLDESWYYGLVNDYHSECKLYHIKYDDRDEEWVDLKEEKFKILLFQSEVPGKAISKRVSPGNHDVVHRGETVPRKGDDGGTTNYLDSEPIALWLARSSQHGKSLAKSSKMQKTSHMEQSMVSPLASEKIDNMNSNIADSRRSRSNPDSESTSVDNSVHGIASKSFLGTITGDHVVYVRKNKKVQDGGSVSRGMRAYKSVLETVTPLAPVTVSSPNAKKGNFNYGVVDFHKDLWSIDHQGLLRLNIVSVESKEFRFHICFPLLPFRGFSLGIVNLWLIRNILMLQHGVMLATSPPVVLEMLFIDSYLGLRLLLFEGSMKQALAFVPLILIVFSQPDRHMNGEMQSPVPSIRFRLSCVNRRKHYVFEFHSSYRLQKSKWLSLESKFLQRCLSIKQLPVSECSYNNIKELEYGSLKQRKPHVGFELSSYEVLIVLCPMGVFKEACSTRVEESALSSAAKPGKVSQFALCFCASPTLFLTLHLQSLMKHSFAWDNLHHHDALCSLESSENGRLSNAEYGQLEPNPVVVQDIISDQSVVSFPSLPTSAPSPTSNLRNDPRLGGMMADIPSCDQANIPLDRGSSISSPLEDLSPLWLDGSPKFMRSGFSNGPKKPRTQVQYTLPGAGYVSSSKQKLQNQRALPCKRIRRASLKRISDGSRSKQKNFQLLACGANVLVTHGDKGWRDSGALIVLEAADHNEWKLAIKLSGVTKYTYKVKHILQTGSTNRYSHSVLWKGGKDWVLEFPDRSQWTLFKEIYEECYNRNIRAASVKNIPIPGVQLIDDSDDPGNEVPFVRNSRQKYFRQVQTDVEMAMDPSQILYDMDSDDEQWLEANRECGNGNRYEEISEEFLEKIMDMFEKVSYVQHRDNFTDAEIQELVIGVGSEEAAKVVYEHWREKRRRKGMPLIRHLQPPLWGRYKQQLKKWEHTIARGNSTISVEKPAMFAFCLRPRGLDVPNKGSKQRSHRKFPVSRFLHTASGDHENILVFGKGSNGRTFADEKVLYTNTVHECSDLSHFSLAADVTESTCYPKVYKNKHRKLSSYPSFSNNPRPIGTKNGVQLWNMEQMYGSDLHEFQVPDASGAAKHALIMAKFKREKARRLLNRADLAIHKAAIALMTADAIKAAHENPNGGN